MAGAARYFLRSVAWRALYDAATSICSGHIEVSPSALSAGAMLATLPSVANVYTSAYGVLGVSLLNSSTDPWSSGGRVGRCVHKALHRIHMDADIDIETEPSSELYR
jgi:hypothetical protein